jgi:hypothetical protein
LPGLGDDEEKRRGLVFDHAGRKGIEAGPRIDKRLALKVGYSKEARMKKTLILLMVLVLASFASAQNWFKGTLDQAIAKAKVENKLVLVDFYSYT